MDKIVTEYQSLVQSIARSYSKSGVPLEDLLQEGMLGLMEAHKRYDSSRQVKFSTYAVFWIKKYILSAIEQEYRSGLHTIELSENHIQQIADPAPEPEATSHSNNELLKLPPDVPDIEATILRLSFEQQKTIKEIASSLNLTTEKVKQLRQKALRRIKKNSY